jgi:ribonuclease III
LSFLSRFFGGAKTKEQFELSNFVVSRFGYRPKKIIYFERAVTHKSLLGSKHNESNERLEFLGDAIIDAIIAEFLFHRFPNEDEGYLTKIKSKLVSRKTMSEIAEEMEIRNILRYHKGRSINISTIEGNALEALIGAIYLDGGFRAVKKSIKEHIYKKYVNINKVLEEEIDFKSRLFIWCQRSKLNLEFELIEEVNKGSSWEYKTAVMINDHKYGIGTGSTKKASEQAASKETLELLGEI